jgi:hypothetical protein
MTKLFNIEQGLAETVLHILGWMVQYGFWFAVFLIIFLITYLGSADMQQFRYVGF